MITLRIAGVLLAVLFLVSVGCAGQDAATAGEEARGERRSANIIYADEIQERRPASLEELLVGRVAGVHTEGGELRIRGSTSLRGGNEPLYVLDGMPLTGPPTLTMQDVESVEVIKGPEAARYGVRGANGVIVITTKSQ